MASCQNRQSILAAGTAGMPNKAELAYEDPGEYIGGQEREN